MSDEFMLRVDEEYPSDERTAVRLLETKVLSEEHRNRIEALLDKLDKIMLTTNTDVLNEMKNILIGMLDSISMIGKKYSFISEMVLKIDEKVKDHPHAVSGMLDEIKTLETGYAGISDAVIHMNEKLDIMSEGMGVILANVQQSMENLREKNSEIFSRVEEKLSQAIGEDRNRSEETTSAVLERIEEQVSQLAAGHAVLMESLTNKVGELSVIAAETADKLTEAQSNYGKLGDRLGELSVTSAEVINKLDEVAEKIASFRAAKASRKPRKRKVVRRARRARRVRNRRIEDEALDILIINTLKSVSMTIGSLSDSTSVSEQRLRKRLNVLMTRGVVVREKRGRSIFYVTRTETSE